MQITKVSEMIERVARAIAEQNHGLTTWDEWIDEARAAIKAMREPTEAMMNGLRITRECDSTAALWAPIVWRTMIDAALCKEKPDAKT
jgi:hypothetical protein